MEIKLRFILNKKQIPPIKADNDNHVLDNPHIFLDEIMRQAQESDIIKLSMDIRTGQTVNYFKGTDTQVINNREMGLGHLKWADQVLCATNRKRKEINNKIRRAYGRGIEPAIDDKIICLSNYWDIIDENGEASLVNGTIGFIESFECENINYNIRGLNKTVKILRATIRTNANEIFINLPIDYNNLVYGVKSLTPEEEYTIYKYNKFAEEPLEMPLEFNWGYAITTHRAQGSSWPKVLVIEEGFPVEEQEHARHLYTGVTRAEDRLVLVR